MKCEHCREQLLDYVYGLLEDRDHEKAREHVQACPECRAALEAVQAEQKLLASAARAIRAVAEFAVPADAGPAPAQVAETIPMTPIAAPVVRRSLWRRSVLAWASVAAVLLAIGASVTYYRNTVHGYRDVLAQKRKEHKDIAERFAAVPARYQALQKDAIAKLHTTDTPYLHVVGPTAIQPGAKAHLQITSHAIEGTVRQTKDEDARSTIRVKIIDTKTGKAQVARLKCDDDGHAQTEFAAGEAAPGGALDVIVEADNGAGRATVRGTVQVQAPTYVTRIDTNKIAYQSKDVLFFRVLVLDRYTLTPPSQPIAVKVDLLDAAGKAVRSLESPTGPGGILARAFSIDDKLAEGAYTLRVTSANDGPVQSATQRLELVQDMRLPDVQFDQDRYLPGDQVTGIYRGGLPLPPKVLIGQEQVQLQTQPVAPMPSALPGIGAFGAPAGGGPKAPEAKKSADVMALSAVQRFSARIPLNVPAGANRVEMTLPTKDGKKTLLRAEIPLGPTDFAIDFFPEGGDLVGGVSNRVFYRVRAKSGEPIQGDGQVMLLTEKNGIIDSSYQFGMGYIDFVPHPKEKYTARITTPAKTQDIPAPFGKLGILPEGVLIQVASLDDERVPRAVGVQGDPVRLTLRQQGPARRLLLVAQCRGQVVDQRWVEVKREPVQLTLYPTPEAVGMIRVTAYEAHENALQPVAERLVYRTASQRLELGIGLNTHQINAGKSVVGTITARDDKGQPAPSWVLASIVDERHQASPRSLSAHFYLLNEVRTGADLENAQLLLHDGPEATQVLERFLGTHGWRRFVRRDAVIPNPSPKGRGEDAAIVFSRENLSLEAMQKRYEEQRAEAVAPLHKAGFAEAGELEILRDEAAEAAVLAAARLRAFEERWQGGLRATLGLIVALLVVASLGLMTLGTYRVARARQATPAFGGSFACLLASVALFFLAGWLGPVDLTPAPALAAAHGAPAWEVRRGLGFGLNADVPIMGPAPATNPVGDFAMAEVAKDGQMMLHANAGKTGDEKGVKEASKALREQLVQSFARRDRGGAALMMTTDRAMYKHDRLAENEALRRVYEEARKGEKSDGAAPTPPGAVDDMGLKGMKSKKEAPIASPPAAADKSRVEYAPQFKAGLLADTLLWHPALWLDAGSTEVRFDLADGNATYRVLLLGHSPTGRFGFYEKRLDVLGR